MAGLLRGGAQYSNLVSLSDRREREDNGRRLAAVETPADIPPFDLDAELKELAVEIAKVEMRLAYLGGAIETDSLGGAVLGLMGNSADELRRQLRPLREALRDSGDAA